MHGIYRPILLSLCEHPLIVHTAARKVNVTQEFTSLNFTIGDNFTIPCNIEVGVNTAQTTYIITIHREVIFHSRDNISEPVIQYTNSAGQGPLATSTINSTLYTFYNANFTLDVVNFSIPYPEEVRGHGVKYFCNFYTIASGTTIMADTTTAVIPGFSKLECVLDYLISFNKCCSGSVLSFPFIYST